MVGVVFKKGASTLACSRILVGTLVEVGEALVAVGGTLVAVAGGRVGLGAVVGTAVAGGWVGAGGVTVGGMTTGGLKIAVMVRFGVGKTNSVGVGRMGKLQPAIPAATVNSTRAAATLLRSMVFSFFLFQSVGWSGL
jgi:hypothetical protein